MNVARKLSEVFITKVPDPVVRWTSNTTGELPAETGMIAVPLRSMCMDPALKKKSFHGPALLPMRIRYWNPVPLEVDQPEVDQFTTT